MPDMSDASLILRSTRIDVLIPQQDTAGHAAHVGKTVLPQKLCKLHRPASAAAMHDDLVVLVRLEGGDVLADLLERNQLGAVDVSDLIFVGKAAIDEEEFVAAIEHRLHVARSDFPVGIEVVSW